jgi:hypothetical protein
MPAQISENFFEHTECADAMKEFHEWVISVSSSAADFAISCGNLIGLTEIESFSLAASINQTVYDNVRLNGIPAPLMRELMKHTEAKITKRLCKD